MPRMSYKTFVNTARKLGFKAGEIPFSDQELPEIQAATAERKAKGLMAPGFWMDVNGKRVYGSITDLSDAYFGLTYYEVFKVKEGSGEFVETHYVHAKPNSAWDALMLVTSDFANHEAPDFRGVYGETSGDLRIATRDGLHWWMVNWTA